MATKITPISDFRRQASQILKTLKEGGDVVYITQHGRPTAVLLDYEQYEALIAELEDLADLASLDEAVDEPESDYDAFLSEMNAEPGLTGSGG